jgi:oxygen-independent coproporphyrinogen-3 oxidase
VSLGVQPQAPPEDAGRASWAAWRQGARVYQAYTYAYPHKTAYRPFAEPRALADLWADEDKSALFLYVHVPFCEMRCGFCNLFTRVTRDEDAVDSYLDALARQTDRVSEALGETSFARVAFGGGTPTHMTPAQLARMLGIVSDFAGGRMREVPLFVETSPETATEERLALLRDHGVDRVSMGVQSFDDDELKVIGRPSTGGAARAALDRIRAIEPAVLNIDLIYGGVGQTPARFVQQIKEALAWEPEEVFLYPLYVRPLTGLGRKGDTWDDERLACYRAGRDHLLSSGYEQFSLRLFRKTSAPALTQPPYRCQDDGMVGLGCGARSYTRAVHYADEWAVGKDSVRGLIEEWSARPRDAFGYAALGFELDEREQKTRWLLQSLLNTDGLDRAAFRERFAACALEERPELHALREDGLLVVSDEKLTLTPAGLELSDSIGPWLWTTDVNARMRGYELK